MKFKQGTKMGTTLWGGDVIPQVSKLKDMGTTLQIDEGN